jgi:hypothetical protein
VLLPPRSALTGQAKQSLEKDWNLHNGRIFKFKLTPQSVLTTGGENIHIACNRKGQQVVSVTIRERAWSVQSGTLYVTLKTERILRYFYDDS